MVVDGVVGGVVDDGGGVVVDGGGVVVDGGGVVVDGGVGGVLGGVVGGTWRLVTVKPSILAVYPATGSSVIV